MAPYKGTRNSAVIGTKVFIEKSVLERIDSTTPAGMSRTAWVAYLLQIGMANAPMVPATAQTARG